MTKAFEHLLAVAVVLVTSLSLNNSLVAQSSSDEGVSTQETQKRGYWIDPSTGLMWAGKDNRKDVSWKAAMRYCRDLRLAGYSDWRLATLSELDAIYDKNASAPPLGWPRKG